ncbi:MAG TPA: acyl-CoA dehydrogenase family protein [Myxococcales bacterium]
MSSSEVSAAQASPGGGFLVAPFPGGGIFSREKLSEDQKLFGQTAEKFWKEEVLTRLEAIEGKATVEEGGKRVPLAMSLLQKCCDLGLVGLDIPEEYGGMGADKTTSVLVSEVFAGCSSMAVTFGAHSGIGMLPIVLFGNDAQKKKYLPRLMTRELVSCYALTEPGSGSDALSGKTKATAVDGGAAYLLNGEKQYITNANWADIAVVFAGVEGKYSGFVVDLHSPGVTRGAEEKKMGIHGSSTATLTFENVRVPKEDLLGEIGDGPAIALNILYVGRLKLGFSGLGTSKYVIEKTLAFGRDRKQFGQPVISFEMQKAKLADMVCSTFALDSLAYRTIGAIDERAAKVPKSDPGHAAHLIDTLRSFGVEASIVKVFGTETLMRVANHGVRMHGGYGFCEHYQVERILRDNVVDTIFEGTNDINRMLAFGTLVQNIFAAEFPFRETMDALHAELRAGRYGTAQPAGPLGLELKRLADAKRALAYTVETAIIGLGKDVRVEQQVAATLTDALIALYAAESTLARVLQLRAQVQAGRRELLDAIARIVVHEKCADLARCTLDTLSHVAPPAELPARRSTLTRLLEGSDVPVDTMRLKRLVADHAIETGRYDL